MHSEDVRRERLECHRGIFEVIVDSFEQITLERRIGQLLFWTPDDGGALRHQRAIAPSLNPIGPRLRSMPANDMPA